MDWAVYLLSICTQLAVIQRIATIIGSVCFFGWCISKGLTSECDSGGEFSPPEKRDDLARAKAWKVSTYFGRGWVIAFIIAVFLLLVPTRKAIVEAYMMKEGAQVVNAPNAEKAITEFAKRFDRIIDIVDKK